MKAPPPPPPCPQMRPGFMGKGIENGFNSMGETTRTQQHTRAGSRTFIADGSHEADAVPSPGGSPGPWRGCPEPGGDALGV